MSPSANPPGEGEPEAGTELTPRGLLLVDDSPSNRLTLQVLLEDEGYVVDTAASFAEAQQRLGAEEVGYRLLILDEHLGDGLGSELAVRTRRSKPHIRLLLMSGSLSYAETVLATDTVDAVLDKNSDFPAVLAVIQRLLT